MAELSSRQAYDEAKRFRDWIRAAEHARLPQAVELDAPRTCEIVWLRDRVAAVLEIREGDTVGLRHAEASTLTPGERELVGNAEAAARLPSRRVHVPPSTRSRRGQLLRIARLNHEQFVDRIET